jgi:glycosyltransferase involved in cell wall biosynthesis
MKSKALLTLERKEPRPEVLVVTSGWPNEDDGTFGIFIKRQMESLIERGLRCDVLFVRGYRSPFAYPLAALRLFSWSLPGAHRRYRLLHAHGGEAALAAAFYRRAPLLVSYLGSDLLGAPRADGEVYLARRIRRAVIRQHSRLTARTITKSRDMQSVLPGSVRARNTVLPNGVDIDLFRPIDRAAARRELGMDMHERVALFVADPSVPGKRYWLAEAAVKRARRLLPDLRLQIAQGVAPDRVPWLMNAADCLLLTSVTEGSPNVVKEALMCNLPVVATPAGDVAELVEGVEPSYVCEPSETALSGALVECLREPRRSNGRDASDRLDARIVADSLLALYKELAPELDLASKTIAEGCADTAETVPG